MTSDVEILDDSVCETAPHRLTTFRVRCPVFVHYEILRHRAFSFSVASTRAIPLRKQIQQVRDDPFVPISWGSAKAGMQAGEELEGWPLAAARIAEKTLRLEAIRRVGEMDDHGLHKQTAGRYLLPWRWMDMIITGCWPAYANFFALRCHRKAQPETRRLAVRMADAYRKSIPRQLQSGGWHLPYVDPSGGSLSDDEIRIDIALSVAGCGRVSFDRHGSHQDDIAGALKFHDDRLRDADWSVFEHQAQAPEPGDARIPAMQGNLSGWVQYRQTLPQSVYTKFNFSVLDSDFSADLS